MQATPAAWEKCIAWSRIAMEVSWLPTSSLLRLGGLENNWQRRSSNLKQRRVRETTALSLLQTPLIGPTTTVWSLTNILLIIWAGVSRTLDHSTTRVCPLMMSRYRHQVGPRLQSIPALMQPARHPCTTPPMAPPIAPHTCVDIPEQLSFLRISIDCLKSSRIPLQIRLSVIKGRRRLNRQCLDLVAKGLHLVILPIKSQNIISVRSKCLLLCQWLDVGRWSLKIYWSQNVMQD